MPRMLRRIYGIHVYKKVLPPAVRPFSAAVRNGRTHRYGDRARTRTVRAGCNERLRSGTYNAEWRSSGGTIPSRIVGKPPTTSGPTAEEECPEISIQFSCKKLFIPTVAERRRRRHPPGRKLGESRRLAPKTPHGQARAAFSTAQPRPFFFPIFRKAERLYALAVSPTLRG